MTFPENFLSDTLASKDFSTGLIITSIKFLGDLSVLGRYPEKEEHEIEAVILGHPLDVLGFKSATVTQDLSGVSIKGISTPEDLMAVYNTVSAEEWIKGHQQWKATQSDPRKPVQMADESPKVLDIAKNEELDKLGELYGIKRKVDMGEVEDDTTYRKRLLEAALNIGSEEGTPDLPVGKTDNEKLTEFFFPHVNYEPSQSYTKCECGVDAVSGTGAGTGGRHSSWCPRARYND